MIKTTIEVNHENVKGLIECLERVITVVKENPDVALDMGENRGGLGFSLANGRNCLAECVIKSEVTEE